MNPKNTVTLALTLGLLMLGLYVVRSRSNEPVAPAAAPARGPVTSRTLIEESPGEVVDISIKRPDREAWHFEKKADKDGGDEVWHMTGSRDFKVVSWEVEKLPRQLGTLMYDISYEAGQAGSVTPEQAGLAPPRATVSLSDREGNTAVVEIGGPAGKQETYVRLAGSPRICVGKSSLAGLFKDKPIEYREKLLWTFDENDATRLEVVDRGDGGASYVFTRDGARWMIEAPVSARATAKVQEAIAALARPRVIQWHDDDESRLPIYGLKDPALTLRVTVEETVNPETTDQTDEDAEAPPAPPEKQQRVYALHVSDRSPIGEDTKAYISVGDDASVGTIMKTTVDKVKPVLSDWRDRQLTTVDVTAATGFELSNAHGTLTAISENDAWRRGDGTGTLDEQSVNELLKGLHSLTASAYVESSETASDPFGFGQPQASITLTVPGAPAPERFVLGSYTDETSRRLLFARHNDELAVAKVRVADVQALLQDLLVFADRAVLDLPPAGIVGLSVVSANALTGEPQTLTYTKENGTWSLSDPVSMAVDQASLEKLATALAGLRGTNVVSTTDVSSAYGLHDPDFVVTITSDMTLGTSTAEGENAGRLTSTLLVTSHDGKHYAKRKESETIYQLDGTLSELLTKANATEKLWSFEPAAVSRFSVEGPDGTFAFEKSEDRWRYAPEPDLPLDNQKVEGLLLRLRDLRVSGVADYIADDLGTFGLDQPAYRLSVAEGDATPKQLAVGQSSEYTGKLFARTDDGPTVYLLEGNALGRFSVTLDALESSTP